ncbi:hypothetical protein H6P81_009896 [Aristolochia fimbriata]|uniref:Uncharacterized protein n=1 Tax=Aristolochia fimbriata TaxID=158543 RepID=A0AAV7ENB6_ARIFI|nr:hypothetical protein H6P81_009896 [Aristolochia fimbriata]
MANERQRRTAWARGGCRRADRDDLLHHPVSLLCCRTRHGTGPTLPYPFERNDGSRPRIAAGIVFSSFVPRAREGDPP